MKQKSYGKKKFNLRGKQKSLPIQLENEYNQVSHVHDDEEDEKLRKLYKLVKKIYPDKTIEIKIKA